MNYYESDNWYKIAEFKKHIENMADLDKLLYFREHHNMLSYQKKVQEGTAKNWPKSETFEKVPNIDNEIESTMTEWRAVFGSLYQEWKAEGHDVGKTIPYPNPPGFKPEKQKEKDRLRTNLNSMVRRNYSKKQEQLREKREMMKRERIVGKKIRRKRG